MKDKKPGVQFSDSYLRPPHAPSGSELHTCQYHQHHYHQYHSQQQHVLSSRVMTDCVVKLASQAFCQTFLSDLPVRLSPGADVLKPLSIVRFPTVPSSHLSSVSNISSCYTIYPLHTTVLLRLSFARITHSTCFEALLTLYQKTFFHSFSRQTSRLEKQVGETFFPPRPARGSPQTEPRARSPHPHTIQCHRSPPVKVKVKSESEK